MSSRRFVVTLLMVTGLATSVLRCSSSRANGDGADGGPGTGSATGCSALAACCSTLTGPDATSCTESLTLTATQCAEVLSTFQSLGMCGGSSPGSGIGTSTGPTGSGSGSSGGMSSGSASASASASTSSGGATTADAGGATTTIAAARQGNVTSSITVNAFVTALAGVPNDYPQWYVEDPGGGPYSGVLVYCDPLVSPACTVPEPALHDLIQVTGTLTTYMGQVEFEPTAMKVLQTNATAPPVATLTAADVAPSANSPYRGVYVKIAIATKLIVDSVTPSALADTGCGAVIPPSGGTGVAACTNKCEPPVYSGFSANDGTGNEVYIEAPFFNTDPLQSSPECLGQAGVVAVTVGTAFTSMSGILDVDPYAAAQALSPVLPSDYTLAP